MAQSVASTDQCALERLLQQHLSFLRVRGYSEYTIRNRQVHIRLFLRWCGQNGVLNPAHVTLPVLERYQQFLLDYRKKDGRPLALRSRHSRLVPLRVWFRWMFRTKAIESNPAADLDLPRLGRLLPRQVLSANEVEKVLAQPNTCTYFGLRDRAIMEVLYSTGIRRLEIRNLCVSDLHLDRRIVLVREGKGRKDRYVPIGTRAVYWVRRYLKRARAQFGPTAENTAVFLNGSGMPLSRDHLTWIVRKHVASAKLGKTGACHLFRHTVATLMHENGADIRCIQQLLGHEDIRTTQIYTRVAIRRLQEVHAATHPAAGHKRKSQAGFRTTGQPAE